MKWTQWIVIKLFNSWDDKDHETSKDINTLIKPFKNNRNLKVNAYSSLKSKFNSSQWKTFNWSERILPNYRLAFLSKRYVNWCTKLGSVLANEEIENQISKIGGYPVCQKQRFQWSLRIKAYLKTLLKDLSLIECTNKLKSIQNNWIGETKGIKIVFYIYKDNQMVKKQAKLEIFTTKPYLVFGISFFCFPLESSLIKTITKYIPCQSIIHSTNRIGGLSGLYAVNDLNPKKIPIYFSNLVKPKFNKKNIPSENFESYLLAKKFNLQIKKKISQYKKQKLCRKSQFLNDLDIKIAKVLIIKYILKNKLGCFCRKHQINKAIFSRQRYWGEPIPINFKNQTKLKVVLVGRLQISIL